MTELQGTPRAFVSESQESVSYSDSANRYSKRDSRTYTARKHPGLLLPRLLLLLSFAQRFLPAAPYVGVSYHEVDDDDGDGVY